MAKSMCTDRTIGTIMNQNNPVCFRAEVSNLYNSLMYMQCS